MSPKNHHQKEDFTRYENDLSITVPELMILGLLGVCAVIAMLLCLDTHKCLQTILIKRKRLTKALQYQPSEDLTRVTPGPGENKIYFVKSPTQDMAKDTQLPDKNTPDIGGLAETYNTEAIPVTIENMDEIVEQRKDNLVLSGSMKI